MAMSEIEAFPWWYLANRSTVLNNLCLVLGGHLNKNIISPLTATKRDEITSGALTAADQFLENCLLAITDPGKTNEEARYDLFLTARVLYNYQKMLGIKLDEHDEDGFKKEFEQYRQLLKKIISYDPAEDQPINDDEVLHLMKFFDALANFIHVLISARHRLLMTRGRSR